MKQTLRYGQINLLVAITLRYNIIMLNIQALIQEYFSDKTIGTVTHTFDNHYMVNVGRAVAYFSIVNDAIHDVQFD